MKFGYSVEDVGYGKNQYLLYLQVRDKERGFASCPQENLYFKLNHEQLGKLKDKFERESKIQPIPEKSMKSLEGLIEVFDSKEKTIPGEFIENFLILIDKNK